MKRNLRGLAVAGPVLLALCAGDAALAQKQGGTLKISFFDSPASMSLHEEATGSALRPIMGVFNNSYREQNRRSRRSRTAPTGSDGGSSRAMASHQTEPPDHKPIQHIALAELYICWVKTITPKSVTEVASHQIGHQDRAPAPNMIGVDDSGGDVDVTAISIRAE
jgi:hypothetical protein